MSHDLHCTEDDLCAWLIDAQLDANQRLHLDRCSVCKERLRELEATVDRLRTDRDAPAPELWSRVQESFFMLRNRRLAGTRLRPAPAMAVAAAILVLGFGLGYRFAQHQGATTESSERIFDSFAKAPLLPFTSTAPLEIGLPEEILGDRGVVNDSL